MKTRTIKYTFVSLLASLALACSLPSLHATICMEHEKKRCDYLAAYQCIKIVKQFIAENALSDSDRSMEDSISDLEKQARTIIPLLKNNFFSFHPGFQSINHHVHRMFGDFPDLTSEYEWWFILAHQKAEKVMQEFVNNHPDYLI